MLQKLKKFWWALLFPVALAAPLAFDQNTKKTDPPIGCETTIKDNQLAAQGVSDKVLSQTTFNCGIYTTADIPVPDGVTYAKMYMSRDSWKDTGKDVIGVTIDVNNGKWFNNFSGFTTNGGDIIDQETGQLSTETYVRFALPDGKGRLLRVNIKSTEDLTSTIGFKFE